MNKPVIGLTASHDLLTDDLKMGHFYIDAIRKNGAIPLVLPLTLDEEEAGQLADTLDGFLFSGGPDVHPFLFGEETLAGCGDFSPLRDSSELLLLSQVYERKKPVLGICRGAQLINIALGGDIYQDIFSQLSGRVPIAHRQPFNATHPAHRVAVEAGSRLAQISGHPQCRPLPDGLRPCFGRHHRSGGTARTSVSDRGPVASRAAGRKVFTCRPSFLRFYKGLPESLTAKLRFRGYSGVLQYAPTITRTPHAQVTAFNNRPQQKQVKACFRFGRIFSF